MARDRQLKGIRLTDVLEKRRLDQALNAKEFAVLAGVSYSTAREWFHIPGFPLTRGVIFWSDFVRWRASQHFPNDGTDQRSSRDRIENGQPPAAVNNLPSRAARILVEADSG